MWIIRGNLSHVNIKVFAIGLTRYPKTPHDSSQLGPAQLPALPALRVACGQAVTG